MRDPFADLGVDRRPLLDDDQLRTRYLQLAKAHHPDGHFGDKGQFDSLVQSYETLRDPAKRLRVLAGATVGKWMPPDDLFEVTAEAIEAAREVTHSRLPRTTALAAALHEQKTARARALLADAEGRIEAADTDAHRRLAELDSAWPTVSGEVLAALASELTFLSRWKHQLTEAGFELNHSPD